VYLCRRLTIESSKRNLHPPFTCLSFFLTDTFLVDRVTAVYIRNWPHLCDALSSNQFIAYSAIYYLIQSMPIKFVAVSGGRRVKPLVVKSQYIFIPPEILCSALLGQDRHTNELLRNTHTCIIRPGRRITLIWSRWPHRASSAEARSTRMDVDRCRLDSVVCRRELVLNSTAAANVLRKRPFARSKRIHRPVDLVCSDRLCSATVERGTGYWWHRLYSWPSKTRRPSSRFHSVTSPCSSVGDNIYDDFFPGRQISLFLRKTNKEDERASRASRASKFQQPQQTRLHGDYTTKRSQPWRG